MTHLSGKRVLVTSGSTLEPIDPVRFISNRSSGKQGHAIAAAFAEAGAEVVLVSGPVCIEPPTHIHQLIHVETAKEMLDACLQSLPVDIAVCVAAVCDWRIKDVAGQKLKKEAGQDELALHFVKNPDILYSLSHHKHRPERVIGFAAETENLFKNAQKKLDSKGCDWLMVNHVGQGSDTFGGDHNQVSLLTQEGGNVIHEAWNRMSKKEVAHKLVSKCFT